MEYRDSGTAICQREWRWAFPTPKPEEISPQPFLQTGWRQSNALIARVPWFALYVRRNRDPHYDRRDLPTRIDLANLATSPLTLFSPNARLSCQPVSGDQTTCNISTTVPAP